MSSLLIFAVYLNHIYCTEAVNIMMDYLFLSKDIVRVQARTDERNVASQKVLQKTGFKKDGVMLFKPNEELTPMEIIQRYLMTIEKEKEVKMA